MTPLISSTRISAMLPSGHGLPRRRDGPSLPDGPSRPLPFARMEQEIRYLDFEGRRLAYSTYGEGPPLVVGPRWVSHLEEEWADPDQRPFYAELGAHPSGRALRPDRLWALLARARPAADRRVREPPARGGDRRSRRERGRLRLVVLLPGRLAARRAPAGSDRQARLLRRLRVAPRHPRTRRRLR